MREKPPESPGTARTSRGKGRRKDHPRVPKRPGRGEGWGRIDPPEGHGRSPNRGHRHARNPKKYGVGGARYRFFSAPTCPAMAWRSVRPMAD